MEKNFSTNIGKIYINYDNFDRIRIINITDKTMKVGILDKYNHIDTIENITISKFREKYREYSLVSSEGVMSISNVVSAVIDSKEIKDVIIIYFPNNKATHFPEPDQPYIVARQGINNQFEYGHKVGMALSKNSGSVLKIYDILFNEKVLSSRIVHVYKTDTEKELSILFDNDESNNILKSLYDHAIATKKKEDINYTHIEQDDDCIDGYCNSIKRFLTESGFMLELYNYLNIIKVDFKIKPDIPINDDDKLLISILYGGIKIMKIIPFLFDYDINMNVIKMRYILIKDINNILWIAPYTISDNEIDPSYIYNLNNKSVVNLQERLKKIVNVYINN